MGKKTTEKEANGAIRAVENELNKKEKQMKKLTINPEVKGAAKVIFIIAVLALAVYAGWELRGNDNERVTAQAQSMVAKLKPEAK